MQVEIRMLMTVPGDDRLSAEQNAAMSESVKRGNPMIKSVIVREVSDKFTLEPFEGSAS